MNVFVLCTERSGSHTFAAACAYIANYTVGHETRGRDIDDRLGFGDGHIEVDNRLAWFLGDLHRRHGGAYYVHLRRDPAEVAKSLVHQFHSGGHGIMNAWTTGILKNRQQPPAGERERYARAFVDVFNGNIEMFLRDKTSIELWIENPHQRFDEMWAAVGAEGDREAAHAELDRRYHRRGARCR